MENERADAGRDGRTLSREKKFSGANESKGKNKFPSSTDHEQNWRPYPVDSYSAESADHTYVHISLKR